MDKIYLVICEEQIDGAIEVSTFPHRTMDGAKARMKEQIDDLIEWNGEQKHYTKEEIENALKDKTDDWFLINAGYDAYYLQINIIESEISD